MCVGVIIKSVCQALCQCLCGGCSLYLWAWAVLYPPPIFFVSLCVSVCVNIVVRVVL